MGTYTLTETNGPSGYTQTGVSCSVNGGDAVALVKNDAGKYVFPIAVQQNVVCEFQNDDIAPTLTLKKNVVNTGGGIQSATAWTLTAAKSGDAPVDQREGYEHRQRCLGHDEDGDGQGRRRIRPLGRRHRRLLAGNVVLQGRLGHRGCRHPRPRGERDV